MDTGAANLERQPIVDPRWVGLGFAIFGLALGAFAATAAPPAAFVPLTLLIVAAPALGLLSAPRGRRERTAALGLLLVCLALAFAVVAASGWAASPLWPALVPPLFAALLLLPGAPGRGVAAAIWLAYGALALVGSPGAMVEAAAAWLLRGAELGLVAMLLERTVAAQRAMRARALAREAALHKILAVSNRLRVTTSAQRTLEEVAEATQGAGSFDCVTISTVDWGSGRAQVAVALGASGRRLSAVEGLSYPYAELGEGLAAGPSVGTLGVELASLPFRALPDELHLALPLTTQLDAVRGVLTVSAARERRAALREALPLLELLANQAAAALDNAELYTTMAQRVQAATADLERGADELRRARDRAEVLYELASALAVTLDERKLLEQTLALVAGHVGAERGGIMLLEPNTGHLVYRTTIERHKHDTPGVLERGQGLAGWVLVNRAPAIVPDTTRDQRWQVRSRHDSVPRAALAVPVMLEREVLGVLLLIHSRVGHFSAEHAQIAQAAAAQAAAALGKAQLYRYVSEQSDHLAVTVAQREEEASKLMAVLRSIGDGVVVSDRHGLIRLVNPAAEQILGITAEAFLGRPLEAMPGVPPALEAAEGDERMRKFGAGERTVRAHCAPVHSARGEALGSVVVYHDISAEETADRLKSELVATASHELRTPMTSIRGFVDMLLLGTFGEVDQSHREPLLVIKNNVVQLVQLIDELLDMSRVEAGEAPLRVEALDIAELIRDVTATLGGQFSERQVALDLDLPGGLPPIQGDRQRLAQVAVNLIGNACKYTPRGGAVRVALRNGGGEVRVDVRDTGVGIPPESHAHIFTPFYRADNPLRDEVGGTGLGLSITRKLVELHGGRIWFESRVNEGSTFSFTLPVEGAAGAAE